MKKAILIVLCILAMAVFAAAQYVPTQDVLGAHNNGGRGCAGCHAPHSGSAGNGGNAISGKAVGAAIDNALFGQDLGPLYGQTFTFGKGASVTFDSSFTQAQEEEFRSIGMCLACHDGSVAKGAMMTNQAYEQRFGILPTDTYGGNQIPTLLGSDGTYTNDHPVGPTGATLASAHMQYDYTVSIDATKKTISYIVPKSQRAKDFVSDYGMPALAGTPWAWGLVNPDGNTDPNKVFVACTTCHNQHVMNVYAGLGKAAKGTGCQPDAVDPTKCALAGDGKTIIYAGTYASATDSGTYKTYFFINGPYNVDVINRNAGTLNNTAPTTSQFCRQCHLGEANEAFGLKLPSAF